MKPDFIGLLYRKVLEIGVIIYRRELTLMSLDEEISYRLSPAYNRKKSLYSSTLKSVDIRP